MKEFVLTTDIGNTNIKHALFSSGDKSSVMNLSDSELDSFIGSFGLSEKNTFFISSDVSKDAQSNQNTILQYRKNNNFLGMNINYEESLGQDRLAFAYYCYKTFIGPTLAIDTGSFTTIDLVTESGFQGGFIMPGLEHIKNCYNHGALLKEQSSNKLSGQDDIPQTTDKAISQGALRTFLAPINELIRETKAQNIIITGGNGLLLLKYIDTDLEVFFQENCIHRALNLIAKEVQ